MPEPTSHPHPANVPPSATKTVSLTTFLFTDIEGSSARFVDYPEAMQEAVARHDSILRREIESCSGTVFRTGGDAFLATFSIPSDAIKAAISIQAELAAQDWSSVGGLRVRVAIHFGRAQDRDGDFYGAAPNCCAKLLALGHGGQILITSVVADLTPGDRDLSASLVLLGSYPLDDLRNPVRIYQVCVPGVGERFPPLRAAHLRPPDLTHPPSVISAESDISTSDAVPSSLVHYRGRLPPAYTGEFLASAKTDACVIGFSLKSFVGYFDSRPASEIKTPIIDVLDRGVSLQMLFLDPDSAMAQQFAAERGGDRCIDEIRRTITRAMELRAELQAPKRRGKLDLRTYEKMPFAQIKRVNRSAASGRILFCPYLPADRRAESPYVEICRQSNPVLFEVYNSAVQTLLDSSRVLT